jgi:transporter family-2 protein
MTAPCCLEFAMHPWWLLALPFIAGSLMPLQAGINGQVARQLSSVMAAALLSFSVGTLALLCIVLMQRGMPGLTALRELSGYHWLGGLFGAVFIAVAAFAAPRIGGLVMMVLILAGQLGMALLLDHFGWVGYREAPVSAGKLGGLALIAAGIWLIQRG